MLIYIRIKLTGTLMKLLKYGLYTLAGTFGLAASVAGIAAIDIATNDHNSDHLPESIDLQSDGSPTIDPHSSAYFYIEAADTRSSIITLPDTNRQFSVLHAVDDDETGFTASAYQEIGTNNVILVFNGMSKPWVDNINTPDENPLQSWDDLLTGVESRFGIVNRQMGALYEFMNDVTQISGENAQYEAIGYSLGGIHGLHAKAVWGIPFTGLSPAGLPNHPELYSGEELDRLNLSSSFSLSTTGDFITGSVGATGPMEYIDLDSIKAENPDLRIDSIGPHILPTGYNAISTLTR